MPFTEQLEVLRNRRNTAVAKYCAAVARDAAILRGCPEEELRKHVGDVFAANGLEIPDCATKPELIDWIVVAAQAYIENSATRLMIVLSAVQGQPDLIDGAILLEYESWLERFHRWCAVAGRAIT